MPLCEPAAGGRRRGRGSWCFSPRLRCRGLAGWGTALQELELELCLGPRRDASKHTAEASASSLCLPLTSCLKDANAPRSSCSCCQAHLSSSPFLICFAAEAVEQVQSLQHSFPDIYRCFHREGGLQERPPGNPR